MRERHSSEKAKLWTGRRLADGRPEIVSVPVDARTNGGRGIGHYLAKVFRTLDAIPPVERDAGSGADFRGSAKNRKDGRCR